MSRLTEALSYAARGWAVFPLPPGSKEPYPGSRGWKDATTDAVKIYDWWTEASDANIGIWTGGSNLVVLDFDWRNGGDVAWDDWGKDLDTLTADTPGGKHCYFTPRNDDKLHATIATGVDIRSGGKYVIAPSSHTYGDYKWVNGTIPNPLPEDLHTSARVDNVPLPNRSSTFANADGDRPGDAYARAMGWGDILVPTGWSFCYSDGDTDYWRRPNKSQGISASTNHHGNDLLYVWTSSASPFEPDTGYSKFTAYTILNHDGDFTAAAKQLVSEQRNTAVKWDTTDGEVDGVSRMATDNSVDSYDSPFVPGTFLWDFADYCSRQTDAPKEFIEAAGLVGVSVATQGVRGRLKPFPNGLSTNLYTILIGPTTRSRKSTVQGFLKDLTHQAFPFSRLPDKETPERFTQSLADRSGNATLWTPDELGISLAEMYARDFMGGLEGVLLTVYGGDDYTYQRSSGTPVAIRNPHLSILGASTPEALARSGTSALTSGLLPRFSIVYPELGPPVPVGEGDADLVEDRKALIAELRALQEFSQANPEVHFDPMALAVLNEKEAVFGDDGTVARLPVMLYKLAMLSALSRKVTTVTLDDAEAACKVAQRWAEGVARLKPYLFGNTKDKEFEEDAMRAYGFIEGTVTPRAVVARQMRLSESKLNGIERTLQDWAFIQTDTDNGVRVWRKV